MANIKLTQAQQAVEDELVSRISASFMAMAGELKSNGRLCRPLNAVSDDAKLEIATGMLSIAVRSLIDALPYERKAYLLRGLHRQIGLVALRGSASLVNELIPQIFGDPLSTIPPAQAGQGSD